MNIAPKSRSNPTLRRSRRRASGWETSLFVKILGFVLVGYLFFLFRYLPRTNITQQSRVEKTFKALRAPDSNNHDVLQKTPIDIDSSKIEKVIEKDLQTPPPVEPRPGFVVLGMHRSGTSMLSGLMVMGLGYKVGSPLIGGAKDNPKGFFELLPAVLQSDIFLGKQGAGWASNVMRFDPEKAIQQYKNGEIKFKEGEKALSFLNDPDKSPWLQKDPRTCITLPVWLELLDHEPAILFTYRHPVEVANSLERRDQSVQFFAGLRLWTAYNIKAIQNMRGLCVVKSTNVALLGNPTEEIQRISDELTNKCNVKPPPKQTLDKSLVESFFDPNLQHKKQSEFIESEVLIQYGDCAIYDIQHKRGHREEYELDNYLNAMKLWCDLENGSAFNEDYEFPELY